MELVWIMFLAGAIAIVVGGWLNWRNDKVGFWLNAVVVIALAFTTTGYIRAARAN